MGSAVCLKLTPKRNFQLSLCADVFVTHQEQEIVESLNVFENVSLEDATSTSKFVFLFSIVCSVYWKTSKAVLFAHRIVEKNILGRN